MTRGYKKFHQSPEAVQAFIDLLDSRHRSSLLFQAVRAFIIDWEADWNPERYKGHKIEEGMVFCDLEVCDLASKMVQGMKDLISSLEADINPPVASGKARRNKCTKPSV